MTGMEIVLLIIGLILVVGTFIFSTKLENTGDEAKAELSEKQKEDLRKQIIEVFDEQISDFKEQNEIALDKLSVQKMSEMNEYSETILNEINRNHNEVMFLYDMLNEKNKELKNTVRDVNNTQKELKSAAKTEKTATKQQKEVKTEPVITEEIGDVGFMASEAAMKKSKKAAVLDQLDAVADKVADDLPVETEPVKVVRKKRTSSGKTAAQRAKTTVKKETSRENNKDVTVFENGNNNEKIIELSRSGKTNVEIAKELGIGIGEVKLVVDLYAGGGK